MFDALSVRNKLYNITLEIKCHFTLVKYLMSHPFIKIKILLKYVDTYIFHSQIIAGQGVSLGDHH